MIGKILKRSSFKVSVLYVLKKSDAYLLDGCGVLMTDKNSIISSFCSQSLINPRLSKYVGHIPLSFSKIDAPRITDDFMVQLAKEYMQQMDIVNTQYIIVRHSDREHPHCHIVFNRVNNDGKTISDSKDFERNRKVTKAMKEKYGLTFGVGKEKVNVNRLRGTDKLKYEMHSTIKAALQLSCDWQQFEVELAKAGIGMKFKCKGQTDEIQGISFTKDDHSFKGSEIDRSFSFSRIMRNFSKRNNLQRFEEEEQQLRRNQPKQAAETNFLFDLGLMFGVAVSAAAGENESIDENNRRKEDLKKKNRRQLKI